MPPRYVLGISAYYHDSAAALLRDGEIVAAAQEERFTRKKGDADFPLAVAGRLEPDVADVLAALDDSEVPLAQSAADGDLRGVVADERILLDHRDAVVGADDLPGRGADDGIIGVLQRAIGGVLGGDREVELAILEHLGPDAAVDAAAQMLDELAIHERVDVGLLVGRVDGDGHRFAARRHGQSAGDQNCPNCLAHGRLPMQV
ncbi:MAG TPA: carbamoyltransferase N-terminal domain-containing protein [Lacipirellulaceae bacterium]|nr:carbamoyltransferase N-terminal domain-containing protein [Lacipirellulaceae bacterium]